MEQDILEKRKEKRREYNQRYRLKHPEKIKERKQKESYKIWKREYQKKYNKEHYDRDYHLEWKLLNRYGITLDEYNELLIKQDYKCAICETNQLDYKNKKLHVDHDHMTNKVRGLLCDLCNRGLGFFKENKNSLKNAINYLEKYNEETSKSNM